MKFNLNWLQSFFEHKIDRDKLLEKLSMSGFEIESVNAVANEFTNVVVGHIVSVEPHPDAKKLQVCQVDVGNESLQIVCGGKNARTGIKVACAVVGAVIEPDFNITQAKLRGVDSFGMLCSEKELGLADSSDGIMELANDAPIGEDLRTYLQLDDIGIHVDVTPNRGDCLSVEGIAREVAALLDISYQPVMVRATEVTCNDTLPIHVEEQAYCPHYVGRIIKNIDMTKSSPIWMQECLRRCGMRAIDPVVDVTNYVMLELGQPLHAFDLQQIDTSIQVRKNNLEEKLTLLDGKEVTLKEDSLMIADKSRSLALAGIIGGLDSGVSASTKDIFIESALFTPFHIAGKARSYGLNTESSHRFERGVDKVLQLRGLERATELLLEIVGGSAGPVVSETFEVFLPGTKSILLETKKAKSLIGIDISRDTMETILQSLHMKVEMFQGGAVTHLPDPQQPLDLLVTPPSYRYDIVIEEDLIEEIARVYGYDKIPSHKPTAQLALQTIPEQQVNARDCKNLLVNRGYREVINYSFIDAKEQRLLSPDLEGIALMNPLSSDMGVMRTTLWNGLIKSLRYNQNRQHDRIRLFEAGRCFYSQDEQPPMLAGLSYGNLWSEQWGANGINADLYHMKADICSILALTNDDSWQFENHDNPVLHPGQQLRIIRNGQQMGQLGALHPSLYDKLDIQGPIILFELNFDMLKPAKIQKFAKLSKYPAIRRDIAVLVDKDLPAGQIMTKIKALSGAILVNLNVFDVYTDQDGGGDKSIGFALTLQHPERTLVDTEVNELISTIVEGLAKDFGAKLRE